MGSLSSSLRNQTDYGVARARKMNDLSGCPDSVSICPFDKNPCHYVESCDDVLALRWGLVIPFHCSRAVFKAVHEK